MPATVSHVFSSPIADWGAAGTVVIGNSVGGTLTTDASAVIGPSDWNQTHSVQYTLTGSEIASLFGAEHRITLTTNAGGVTFGLDNQIAFFEPFPAVSAVTTLAQNAIWYVDLIQLPGALNSGVIREFVMLGGIVSSNTSAIFGFPASTISATSSGNVSKAATFYNRAALYIRGTHSSVTSNHTASLYSQWSIEQQFVFSASLSVGASASSGSSLSISYSNYVSYPTAYDTLGGVTYGTFSGTFTLNSATSQYPALSIFSNGSGISSLLNLFTGGLMIPMPLSSRISAGEWYFAHNQQVSTASGATAGYSLFGMASTAGVSKLIIPEYSSMSLFRHLGSTISNTTSGFFPGHGQYSVSLSTCPSPMPITDIRQVSNSALFKLYWNYDNYTD